MDRSALIAESLRDPESSRGAGTVRRKKGRTCRMGVVHACVHNIEIRRAWANENIRAEARMLGLGISVRQRAYFPSRVAAPDRKGVPHARSRDARILSRRASRGVRPPSCRGSRDSRRRRSSRASGRCCTGSNNGVDEARTDGTFPDASMIA